MVRQSKVSDYIVRQLPVLTGAEHVFLLSGGNLMHLLDSLGSSPTLTTVAMHHEQAAGIAAEAYARTRGGIGICFVTSGPGATNALTAIAGAWTESSPVLFICGQVSRANARGNLPIRQRGIQEIDIVSLAASITKYAVRVDDPDSIGEHLTRAVHVARQGRPGPVLLDIPVDVQGALIDEPSPVPMSYAPPPTRANSKEALLDMLHEAKRPMLILGGGLRTAGLADRVPALVDRLGIPVQTSWNGMDLIEESHPLFFGRAGVFAGRYPNLLVQSADLLLILGARLGMQHTGYNIEAFGRGARKIMVDIDAAEMAKPGLRIDMPIHADLREWLPTFIETLAPAAVVAERTDWLGHCRRIKAKYPIDGDGRAATKTTFVDPFHFVRRLADQLPDNAVVPFGSSGMPHTVTGAVFAVKAGQRVFTGKGLAAMGYGLPSLVGASFAAPGRPVVTLIGEGGLQLNLQDLQTVHHWRLPAKIFVFNNGGYHSIHTTQRGYFDGRFVASGPESGVSFPPLEEVAALYRLHYYRIRDDADLARHLADVIADPAPLLCEVMIDPEQALLPKLASYKRADGTMASRPLEDMLPLLDRVVLQADLTIPLLD